MQGPSRIRLRPLEWSLTSYRYARAFLYFPPTYANPTTRGVGIQVSGWSRDWVSARPFFLPTTTPLPHNRIHCSPVAEVQWSHCAKHPQLMYVYHNSEILPFLFNIVRSGLWCFLLCEFHHCLQQRSTDKLIVNRR